MASVTQVNGKWRALIRRKGHKSQCKTFRTKAQADIWARQREEEIAKGSGSAYGDLTLGEVLKAYRRLRDESRPIADTSNEHYMLKALERGLGELRVAEVTPDHLVAYAAMRREEGAGPYTINMDVSKLGTALRYGGAKLKLALPDVVGSARPTLTYLRLIGGGGKRERRPTEDELRRVLGWLETKGRHYAEAAAFAACSAMRRGEVCGLKCSDIDPATHIALVLRKHPRKGQVLEKVPLLGEAWEIAKRQPAKGNDRLFPIEAATLSKYFTEACRALAIPDLHFHDLRHDGTSKLFEAGYGIQEVALVTGHKSWNMLRRYTQLRPEDLTRPKPGKRLGARPRRGSLRTASQSRDKS